MGLTAAASSAAGSASAAGSSTAGASSSVTTMLSSVGVGVGSVFVALALVALLAYLNLLDADEGTDEELRTTVVATVLPLAVAFVAIVVFESMRVI